VFLGLRPFSLPSAQRLCFSPPPLVPLLATVFIKHGVKILRRVAQHHLVCSGIARILDYQSFIRCLSSPRILQSIANIIVGDLAEACF